MKAVFFDLDDTLYGSFSECDNAAVHALGQYAQTKLGVNSQRFEEAFWTARRSLARAQPGMPPIHDRVLVAQRALEALGVHAIRHAVPMHVVYWDTVMDMMEIREGVKPLLQNLRAHGVKVAICTDMMADIQMRKLERLGIADDVDFMVSSEEAGRDKPAPPIFWLALQKCGCLAADAVMVGDNFVHDVVGATDCGIAGVWLNWNGQPKPTDTRAYYEARSFLDVQAYLEAQL